MFRTLLVSCVVLGTGTALAEPIPYTTTEQAFETSSDLIVLPSMLPTSIPVRGCPECAITVLRLTNETQFLLNKEVSSLQEVRRHAVKNRNIAIFYDPGTKTVKRFVLFGVPSEQNKGRSEKRS